MQRRLARGWTPLVLGAALLSLAMMLANPGDRIERWLGASRSSPAGQLERNAYAAKMVEVAARNRVDVKLIAGLRRGRSFDIGASPLFALPDQSLDVLIVGDSSAVWGLSPPIVSQVSGQRVGVFAYGQARPTRNFLRTVGLLAERYLGDTGLILLCFSPQSWSHALEARQVDAHLQALTSRSANELEGFILDKRSLAPAPFTQAHMAAHWKRIEALVASIPPFGGGMPDLQLYSRWIEPVVAPRTAAAALENAEQPGKQMFYHWDDWNSILLQCPECPYRLARPVPPAPKRPDAEMVAAAQLALSLPRELGFVIPFYGEWSSARVRGLYDTVLRGRAALADLESMWPLDLEVATQGSSHVANEGALYQSLLLGYWLQRHARAEPELSRRTKL